jgi:hypothetical protein
MTRDLRLAILLAIGATFGAVCAIPYHAMASHFAGDIVLHVLTPLAATSL